MDDYARPRFLAREKHGAVALNAILGLVLTRSGRDPEVVERMRTLAVPWFQQLVGRRAARLRSDLIARDSMRSSPTSFGSWDNSANLILPLNNQWATVPEIPAARTNSAPMTLIKDLIEIPDHVEKGQFRAPARGGRHPSRGDASRLCRHPRAEGLLRRCPQLHQERPADQRRARPAICTAASAAARATSWRCCT